MSNTKTDFGETDFASEDTFQNNSSKKAEFLKLKDGSNNMRAFTNPHRFLVHKVVFNDDPRGEKKAGWTVRCMGTGCALCKAAESEGKAIDWFDGLEVNEGRPRWYMGVIDRDVSPNVAKTFEFGPGVRGDLKTYAEDKKWGSPLKYDVDVKKNSQAKKSTDWYKVIPDPTSRGPLAPEDEQIASGFDVEGLKAKCKPLTEDQAKDSIKRYRAWLDAFLEGKGGKSRPEPSKQVRKANSPPPRQVEGDEDEGDSSGDYSFTETRES